MSGGKPATEVQLHALLDVVQELVETVGLQQETIKRLVNIGRLQNKRLESLEGR